MAEKITDVRRTIGDRGFVVGTEAIDLALEFVYLAFREGKLPRGLADDASFQSNALSELIAAYRERWGQEELDRQLTKLKAIAAKQSAGLAGFMEKHDLHERYCAVTGTPMLPCDCIRATLNQQ